MELLFWKNAPAGLENWKESMNSVVRVLGFVMQSFVVVKGSLDSSSGLGLSELRGWFELFEVVSERESFGES